MAYDKKAYNVWEKAHPDATDIEKENVKAMYEIGDEPQTDEEVVMKQQAPALDVKQK